MKTLARCSKSPMNVKMFMVAAIRETVAQTSEQLLFNSHRSGF